MNTYTVVDPNGVKHTKINTRTFTHGVLVKGFCYKNPNDWHLTTLNMSELRAIARAKMLKNTNQYSDLMVVELEVAA